MTHVIHLITDLEVGGAERVLAQLVTAKSSSGFRHSVISMTDLGPVGGDLIAAGVEVKVLKMHRGVPSPGALFRLTRILQQSKPSFLQCWMYHANLMGVIAGKVAGVPYILWGIRAANPKPSGGWGMTHWVVRAGGWFSSLPAGIIAVSEAGKQLHQGWGYDASKITVIPNGFDLQGFKPDAKAYRAVREELGLTPDTVIIGLMARFHPVKDHETFLRAAASLRKKTSGVCFLLAGREVTTENPQLSRLIRKNNLVDWLYTLGCRADINRIMASLDIACLSSYSEAFPGVVGEAMACGVPCVVTDVGDSARIVGDTGKVVPPRDPEALAAAWLELIDLGREKLRELGERARARVGQKYSLDRMVNAYESLYVRLQRGGAL